MTLIVAATPRSGSTLLGRLVDTTGPFPRTDEYFNDVTYMNRYGIAEPTVTRKMQEIDTLSRGPGNCISMKLFPPQMMQVLQHNLLSTAFRNARFVFLTREDLLRQAISLYRASVSEQWLAATSGNSQAAEYDASEIGRFVDQLADWNRWWNLFFAINDVPTLRLTYAGIEEDPVETVAQVMSFLGFNPAEHRADLSRIDMKKQRDQVTEEWRERFLAEPRNELLEGTRRPVSRTFRNALRFFQKRLYVEWQPYH
jgi:LPS sulfotransferase NodH